MSGRHVATEIAWYDAKKWPRDAWYPLPIGYMERDQEEYIVDGWRIFVADRTCDFAKKSGDVICLDMPTMTFSQAIRICEEHNNFNLIPKSPIPLF